MVEDDLVVEGDDEIMQLDRQHRVEIEHVSHPD
jgi:hypothetical protein